MTILKPLLVLLILTVLSACQPANEVADIPTPLQTQLATETVYVTTPTDVPPMFYPSQIIASDITSTSDDVLHNVILFFSTTLEPFPNFPEFGAMILQDTFCLDLGGDRCVKITNSPDQKPQLWAISPDAQSGRQDLIVPDAIYFPPDPEIGTVIVVENEMGATYTHEKIGSIGVAVMPARYGGMGVWKTRKG